MYQSYYQFEEKPFSLITDPKYVYFGKNHREALNHILYGIREQANFVAILGDAGSGKTSLGCWLLDNLRNELKVALILNPPPSFSDLLKTVIEDLEIPAPRYGDTGSEPCDYRSEVLSNASKTCQTSTTLTVALKEETAWTQNASRKMMIDGLKQFLEKQHASGSGIVIILDEAQSIRNDVLEEIRLLSNIRLNSDQLFQIIFLGQDEFQDRIQKTPLEQLDQRIAVRWKITPLPSDEIKNYIYHRLSIVDPTLRLTFSDKAIRKIYQFSAGNPRRINLICDRSLLAGYMDEAGIIESQHVARALQSLKGSACLTELECWMESLDLQHKKILFFALAVIIFILGVQAGNF